MLCRAGGVGEDARTSRRSADVADGAGDEMRDRAGVDAAPRDGVEGRADTDPRAGVDGRGGAGGSESTRGSRFFERVSRGSRFLAMLGRVSPTRHERAAFCVYHDPMEGPYRTPEALPLGPLVREHRWAGTRGLVVIGLFFLAPLALVPFALREDLSRWEVMSWVGFAIGCIGMPIGGVAILVTAKRLARNYVRLHENGFDYKWSRSETSVQYGDVVSIQSKVQQKITNGIPGPVTHQHTIKTRDGRSLMITHGYAQVVDLVAALKGRVRAHVHKSAIDAFEAGDVVSFGALSVHKTRGISGPKGHLPFADVFDVRTSGGEISIWQTVTSGGRPWDRVDIADLMNEDVFLALVKRNQPRRDAATPSA